MSDTPRTDAEVFLLFKTGDDEGVPAEFARKLERENRALRNEVVRLNNQTMWVCSCGGTDCAGQKENAGLRGALEESQEYGRNHANAVMKLLSVISRIRFAVDSQPHRSQAMRLEDVGDLCDEVLGKKAQP